MQGSQNDCKAGPEGNWPWGLFIKLFVTSCLKSFSAFCLYPKTSPGLWPSSFVPCLVESAVTHQILTSRTKCRVFREHGGLLVPSVK